MDYKELLLFEGRTEEKVDRFMKILELEEMWTESPQSEANLLYYLPV